MNNAETLVFTIEWPHLGSVKPIPDAGKDSGLTLIKWSRAEAGTR